MTESLKELLRDVAFFLYGIVSRKDEMEGHEDIVATAEELIPKIEATLEDKPS